MKYLVLIPLLFSFVQVSAKNKDKEKARKLASAAKCEGMKINPREVDRLVEAPNGNSVGNTRTCGTKNLAKNYYLKIDEQTKRVTIYKKAYYFWGEEIAKCSVAGDLYADSTGLYLYYPDDQSVYRVANGTCTLMTQIKDRSVEDFNVINGMFMYLPYQGTTCLPTPNETYAPSAVYVVQSDVIRRNGKAICRHVLSVYNPLNALPYTVIGYGETKSLRMHYEGGHSCSNIALQPKGKTKVIYHVDCSEDSDRSPKDVHVVE
jgi:hypothetical protein